MTRTFTPDEIAALIAKLEAATGPDRELDADVMAACFTWAQRGSPYLAPHCIGDEPIYWHAPPHFQKKPVPEVTASVDAALQLMPLGCDWLIGQGQTRPDEPPYGVQVFPQGSGRMVEMPPPIGEGEHPHLAVAICIAALRARASIRASGTQATPTTKTEGRT